MGELETSQSCLDSSGAASRPVGLPRLAAVAGSPNLPLDVGQAIPVVVVSPRLEVKRQGSCHNAAPLARGDVDRRNDAGLMARNVVVTGLTRPTTLIVDTDTRLVGLSVTSRLSPQTRRRRPPNTTVSETELANPADTVEVLVVVTNTLEFSFHLKAPRKTTTLIGRTVDIPRSLTTPCAKIFMPTTKTSGSVKGLCIRIRTTTAVTTSRSSSLSVRTFFTQRSFNQTTFLIRAVKAISMARFTKSFPTRATILITSPSISSIITSTLCS
ncbi:hypothetical protein KPB2_5333 [Klebsiella pneumoniae Kb677]|nr:hypothetical protein KPB2_5333 [Klebsiella pneumoniae Kb677]